MGGLVNDSATSNILFQLRSRFAAGEPIREMAEIHKSLGIFHKKNSLKDIFRVTIVSNRRIGRTWSPAPRCRST